jgi:hypothetical protein
MDNVRSRPSAGAENPHPRGQFRGDDGDGARRLMPILLSRVVAPNLLKHTKDA